MSVSAERRAGFQRIESPTLDQFAEAAEVCYTRWSYMRDLDSPARFRAFQHLKVELCVLTTAQGAMQCVGFLVPSRIEIDGEALSWHYMFQVASRPEAVGAGALLIKRVMNWYPAIFGMGITPDAERLYRAFKWQPYEGFWRGVHPLNLSRFLSDYGDRIPQPWLRRILQFSASAATFVDARIDDVLSVGASAVPWLPHDGKEAVVGGYLKMVSCGDVKAADVGGAGRLLSPISTGSLRSHAAVRRSLRKCGARFCEALLVSESARRRATFLGYIPIPLQVWCWDPQGVLARAIPALRERGFTFLNTDKVI